MNAEAEIEIVRLTEAEGKTEADTAPLNHKAPWRRQGERSGGD